MQVKSAIVLVVAALLFWGRQTGLFLFALPMAAVVGASAFTRKRLALTARELARIWDVTVVLVVGAVIYNRQTLSASAAVIAFLQWLPILLFPFVAAFFFSTSARVPQNTFLFWWRGKAGATGRGLNLIYPYFALCLFSASASSIRDYWFFPAAVLLIACALALNRPKRAKPALALLLFLMVAGSGYFLQARWREFQNRMENTTMKWFAGFYPRQFEDQESHTSLGEIGKVKLSARVVMRVRGENGDDPPRLYRQVSFDQYRRGIWLSTRRQYAAVSEAASAKWELGETTNLGHSVLIRASVPEGKILLPLPMGAHRIYGLGSSRLERNRFGNLRVWDAPDPTECRVEYALERSLESPPLPKDVDIPAADKPVVAQIVNELGLSSMPADKAVETLERFFSEKFRYEPFVSAPAANPADTGTLISNFLNETRAGHCEYFASAGVLLLREAGIPARYATGYAAVESGGSKTEFQIRERHAHAWVLAYIDGRWRDVDPTPHGWNPIELQQSSILRPFSDWWADMRFAWATGKWLPTINLRSALYIAFPLSAALALALLKKRGKLRVKRTRPSVAQAFAWPGLDSEFFLIEGCLRKQGFLRAADETIGAWLERAADRQPKLQTLETLLSLHYRYRFDPDGLTEVERGRLAESARAWLAQQQTT
jgi:hypothetical protein